MDCCYGYTLIMQVSAAKADVKTLSIGSFFIFTTAVTGWALRQWNVDTCQDPSAEARMLSCSSHGVKLVFDHNLYLSCFRRTLMFVTNSSSRSVLRRLVALLFYTERPWLPRQTCLRPLSYIHHAAVGTSFSEDIVS